LHAVREPFLTIAEFTGANIQPNEVGAKLKTFLSMLLESGKSGIRLMPVTRTIALSARNIRWIDQVGGLKGADAIHVATAREMKCDELWTRDERHILKKREELKALGINVLQPSESALIPPQLSLSLAT
jgi:predicted nucleic acid-binding protein